MKVHHSDRWAFCEPAENDIGHNEIVMTEKEILDFYWDYWSNKMRKLGKEHLISERSCIDDWIVVNWAYKKD